MSGHETNGEAWRLAGARRVAQAIGELSFEGLLHPRAEGDGRYSLELAERACYQFRARPSAWGGLHVEIGSVTRAGVAMDSPIALLLDARRELGAAPEVLAEWFEEIDNGLIAEAGQCERLRGVSADQLARLDGVQLEQHLDGHPKLVAHRGRVGWGRDDLAAYAPEFGARVKLHWLVAAPEVARCSGAAERRELLAESCDANERARLLEVLRARAPGLADDGVLVPVHPWQWQRQIVAHYGRMLARGELVSLGQFGDTYAPRLSIRTLANVDRPAQADVKLALTILNTSCWRGLPGAHVEHGAGVGAALRDIVAADPLLRARRVVVLVDRGGVHVPQPEFEALQRAPYRVREMLAAIWRESAGARLGTGEVEIPAAALQQTDLAGAPLVRAWIERSGASPSVWLSQLFARTAVPLYHLLCAHGIGVIAHGQNLGLVLREGLPVGMLLRDVHGDVRRVDDGAHAGALLNLRALPAEQLVHDLYTGYFVSVLRFVAPLLGRSVGLREREFLRILAAALRAYQDEHPGLRERFVAFDVFAPTMPRICLNRARLRAGHGGGETRPLPELGPPLQNPLTGHGEETDDAR